MEQSNPLAAIARHLSDRVCSLLLGHNVASAVRAFLATGGETKVKHQRLNRRCINRISQD